MKIFGLAGWSGSGKTTLMTQLIEYFSEQNIKISTIKHAHHQFDVDKPGKDSYRFRQSGASEVLLSSGKRWALMHELKQNEDEYTLPLLLQQLNIVDLVLIEGFKDEKFPKIQIFRQNHNMSIMAEKYPNIIGIASFKSDFNIIQNLLKQHDLVLLDLDNIQQIAKFILENAVDINDLMEQYKHPQNIKQWYN